ncbi:MAG: lytic transglycosylase domain-containing protein [Alphaproteobacteria bacterium]|jgi:soluble lytic murein transglycosylase-like protein|nr:lytic transglycosylase domain-containing protein [Alphaproteobacteria bacterium]MBU1605441.1 lytic transglycosylase domain-containing protein [Alphaproteobacteria bacterium]
MIRAACTHSLLAMSLAFGATQARADVLQIDGEDARWIAGGASVVSDRETVDVEFDTGLLDGVDAETGFSTGIAHPEHIVGDAARHAQGVPQAYRAKVAELARRFDLSASLIEALVWQESRWRADAISPVGARGLAQLMPGTARELGVNPDDPFANLEGGARYLREQLDRFDGDLERALAAYNAGPGRVIRANGIPRIRETQHYVAAIMGRLSDHSRE